MTDEEIHNIYLHMSGKAEGLAEATGKADFPVLFARAILEYEGDSRTSSLDDGVCQGHLTSRMHYTRMGESMNGVQDNRGENMKTPEDKEEK